MCTKKKTLVLLAVYGVTMLINLSAAHAASLVSEVAIFSMPRGELPQSITSKIMFKPKVGHHYP
jgi:hypothetical protein